MGLIIAGLRTGRAAARVTEFSAKKVLPQAELGATHTAKAPAVLSNARALQLEQARAALSPAQEVANARTFAAAAPKALAIMERFEASGVADVNDFIALRRAADLSLKTPGELTAAAAEIAARVRQFVGAPMAPTGELVFGHRTIRIDPANPAWRTVSPKLDQGAVRVAQAFKRFRASTVGTPEHKVAAVELDQAQATFRLLQEHQLSQFDPRLREVFTERAQLRGALSTLPRSVQQASQEVLWDLNAKLDNVLMAHETQHYGESLRSLRAAVGE